MSYSELENRIIELAGENPINIDEVKKLFDQGADPNAVDGWDENEQDYDDILFTDCTTLFDAPDLPEFAFCGLLLCAAYGGKQQSGHEPFKMLIDAPISIFKDYERYWYEYKENSSTLYVIEKEAGRRIAKYH